MYSRTLDYYHDGQRSRIEEAASFPLSDLERVSSGPDGVSVSGTTSEQEPFSINVPQVYATGSTYEGSSSWIVRLATHDLSVMLGYETGALKQKPLKDLERNDPKPLKPIPHKKLKSVKLKELKPRPLKELKSDTSD